MCIQSSPDCRSSCKRADVGATQPASGGESRSRPHARPGAISWWPDLLEAKQVGTYSSRLSKPLAEPRRASENADTLASTSCPAIHLSEQQRLKERQHSTSPAAAVRSARALFVPPRPATGSTQKAHAIITLSGTETCGINRLTKAFKARAVDIEDAESSDLVQLVAHGAQRQRRRFLVRASSLEPRTTGRRKSRQRHIPIR